MDVTGWPSECLAGYSAGYPNGTVVRPSAVVSSMLVWGLVCGLILLPSTPDISCVETVRWSWSRFWRVLPSKLVRGLWVGLVAGLVFGLAGWLFVGLFVGLRFGLRVGLAGGLAGGLVLGFLAGLLIGLLVGLAGLLVGGLVGGEIKTRTIPNQGVRRSVRNGLGVGLVFSLVVGLIVVLVLGLASGLAAGLDVLLGLGLFFGLFIGLGVGLHAGGGVFLKHVVLRLWLIRNGSTPWNYVRFLDHAAERILLRKVGGGYAFIHRMLLEHFAARYDGPAFGDEPPAKPSSIEDV